MAALSSSQTYEQITKLLGLNAASIGDFMGNPVHLSEIVVYPTDNYGSAVTPFYTNLALWVGGFVLVAIYKSKWTATSASATTRRRKAISGVGCCS